MQRDAWYSSQRSATELASPAAVGRYAAQRALSRLGARKIATTECPVLFESNLAAGLLGGFVPSRQWRRALPQEHVLARLAGQSRFSPSTSTSWKTRSSLRGKGSSPFDEEGVRVAARKVVDAGRVEGYFLSSYSARKLGMRDHGQRGRLAQPGADLAAHQGRGRPHGHAERSWARACS